MKRAALIGLLAACFAQGAAVLPAGSAKALVTRSAVTAPEAQRKSRGRSGSGSRRGGREGWSVAEGQRRATKRRNRLRHKARQSAGSSGRRSQS